MSPTSWSSLCIQNPEGTVSQGFLHPLPWAAWEMTVKLLPAHDWLSVYEDAWFSFFHISGMPFYALGVEWWLMNPRSFQDLNSGPLQPFVLSYYLLPVAVLSTRVMTNTALVFMGLASPEGLSLATLDVLRTRWFCCGIFSSIASLCPLGVSNYFPQLWKIKNVPTLGNQPCIFTKDWCWSWSSSTLATWCEEPTHWKRPWCWERLKAGGQGGDRGWDGWMTSPTQWLSVWANSRA